jgi:hypothetical protein
MLALDDESMPLTEKDKAWIAEQIESSHKPTGWKKAAERIRAFGPPIAILGVLVTLLGITLGALYASFGHLKDETEFRTHTSDTLTIINTTLINIQASIRELQAPASPKRVLGELGALDPALWAENLPALKKVTEQTPEKVSAGQSVLQDIALKLGSVKEQTPDYWPTVLQFINFASASLAPHQVPPAGPPWKINVEEVSKGTSIIGLNFENNAFFFGSDVTLTNVKFVNSRIVLGPRAVLILHKVTFVNCLFEFPTGEIAPSPTIKNTARTLLASGIENATIG